MVRIGQVWQAKPGKGDEYRAWHATVPPEVERALQEGGVKKYVVYGWGDTFFSYMEVEDYDAMVEHYNADPVAREFEEKAATLIEFPEVDPETGWPLALKEIWSMGADDE